ncbi:SDR family NAD(P)-dependent oxidoreductase [Caballeronia ptereochthonis]|uniref:Short-chain dehydrogenase/reductase SDR n=1 Tax=Caballeronia ptereochthonis TaxID=1777144 RepID=A0A158C3A5_9BURK|nr:SDR family oxidoreductase [Caballeronia ptereochthonis]SAK76834.1 Short-chain dehydrogenase/reductase SDR [Caballeronia ptereochthonis]
MSTGSTLDAFRLDGDVCVVTGAAQGIGFSIAKGLREAGATVVIADRDETLGQRAAEELGGSFVVLDVTDSSTVDAAFDTVVARHGKLDVLVNNAGIVKNAPALETDDAAWRAVLAVNLDGVFYCSRSAARHMVRRNSGRIVNIASMSGSIANKPQPQASYNASKAGVIHLTRSLAAEWAAHGVRVNSISPGYVATELTKRGFEIEEWRKVWIDGTPMARMATPEEIAPGVIFLASRASAFVTGSDLVMDGGYTVW